MVACIFISFFALSFASIVAFFLTAIAEYICDKFSIRYYRRHMQYLFFSITGIIAAIATLLILLLYNGVDFIKPDLFYVPLPITALLSNDGNIIAFGVYWSCAYMVIHFFAIKYIFPRAVKRLQRLRPGFWDMEAEYMRHWDKEACQLRENIEDKSLISSI